MHNGVKYTWGTLGGRVYAVRMQPAQLGTKKGKCAGALPGQERVRETPPSESRVLFFLDCNALF